MNDKWKHALKDKSCYMMSFLLPGLVFTLVWYLLKGYPFGDKSILLWDMRHQYVDFFAFLKNILEGNMDAGFSFAKSFGGNNIALFSYYLSSPFNVLLFFFDDIPLFIVVLTGVKIAFSGLTSFFYFKKRFPDVSNLYLLMLSQCYALNAYAVLQASNIMWLDGMVFLPLLLLAVDYYLKDEKKYLLPIMVAVCIIANWYTAYMDILFSSMYYLILLLYRKNGAGIVKLLKKAVSYGFLCLLGVGISAVLFLPNIYSLLLGKGANANTRFNPHCRLYFYHILNGSVIGTPGSGSYAQLNLFCGSIVLMLAALYVFNNRITIKKRVLTFFLMGGLVISAIFIPLENVWNGFRAAYSYYCRFSFIVVMALLMIAGIELQKPVGKLRYYIISFLFVIAAFMLSFPVVEKKELLILTFFFLFVEGILFYAACNRKKKKYIQILLLLTVLTELALNMYICFKRMYVDSVDSYYTQDKQMEELVSKIKETDKGFYRVETMKHRTDFSFCENLVYNIRGVSHYSSGLDQASADILNRMGYSQTNRIPLYRQPILPTDSLFGIKYVISEKPLQGMEQIEDKIWYNPYALSLGVYSKEEDADPSKENNPFEAQNQYISALLGREMKLYKPVTCKKTADCKWELEEQDRALLYGYVDMTGKRDLDLYINEERIGKYTNWGALKVFQADINEETSTSTIELRGEYDETTTLTPMFYQLDMDVYKEAMEELKETEFVPTVIEDGHISGTYTSKEDGYLVLSVLYEGAWEIKVNDSLTEAEEFADTFIAIPVTKGENQIELTYHLEGKTAGIVISLGAIMIFVLYVGYYRRTNHKKKEQSV